MCIEKFVCFDLSIIITYLDLKKDYILYSIPESARTFYG